jgi:hypothetical protein
MVLNRTAKTRKLRGRTFKNKNIQKGAQNAGRIQIPMRKFPTHKLTARKKLLIPGKNLSMQLLKIRSF